MKNLSSPDPDFKLWLMLFRTRDAIYKVRENELRKSSVSPIEAQTLRSIKAIGTAAIPAEISRRVFKKPHSISGRLNRMEKAGLIRKVKDLPQKNLVRVVMTEAGQKAYKQTIKGSAFKQVISSLSMKERQKLIPCLEKLRKKSFAGLGMKPPLLSWIPEEFLKVEREKITPDILADNEYHAIWLLLYQTRDAIYKARVRELNKYNLSPRHTAVLSTIKAIGDRATPAEISRWLFRKPHSVSGILQRMEKDGLINRVKDLERKNLVRVIITEKGEQAFQNSSQRKSIHKIMSSLTLEEQQQLGLLLDKLWQKAIKKLGISYKISLPPFH